MLEGSVIKAFIHQADGKFKARPVVIIKKLPYFDDWLVCGISSKVHTIHPGLDILISRSHPDFSEIGLNYELVIRAGWLNTFPQSKIEGAWGKVSINTLEQIKKNPANYVLKK